MAQTQRSSNAEVANRFAYHPADTQERIDAHENIRSRYITLAKWLNKTLPDSREKSLALTALQEAAQWSNAAVAIHFPHADDA